MSDKKSAMVFVLVGWQLFVTTPLWLFITYSILSSLGDLAPMSAWVSFFLYVPAVIFGVLVGAVVRIIED